MNKDEIIVRLRRAEALIKECAIAIAEMDSIKSSASKASKPQGAGMKIGKIDFDLNPRNFVKTYAKGLNGEKKFTLLLALLAKGKVGQDIEINDVSNLWNKMIAKELLGSAYNSKYPTAAKTNGWINSVKYGTYRLTNTWKEIFD